MPLTVSGSVTGIGGVAEAVVSATGAVGGGQWRDHRQVVNGIIWKYRTGALWRDVPARYGWTTSPDRLVRWRRDGTWERLLA